MLANSEGEKMQIERTFYHRLVLDRLRRNINNLAGVTSLLEYWPSYA
jgi:hypothetical protein